MKTDLFQSRDHCWVFQICWHVECSTFTASSFRIWNSSTEIPSPQLALFVVILSKAHLTLQSRMSPIIILNYKDIKIWKNNNYILILFCLVWKQKKKKRLVYTSRRLSCGLAVKNPPANAEDAGWIPGSETSPGERQGKPLQNYCLGNLGNIMDRWTWWATVHGGMT